jgi:hypothetical protein
MTPQRVKALIGVYSDLTEEDWRRTLGDKVSSQLADEIWASVDRRWQTKDCENLAGAARALEKLAGKAGRLESALDKPRVKQAISTSAVATAMIKRVDVARQQIDKLVLTMRFAGIALCGMHSRLGDCQCLKDLADDVVPEMLEGKLDQVCEDYLAQV